MTQSREHERRLDLTILSLPVITVVSLILFVAWSTFTVAQEKGRYDNRLEATTKLIEQLAVATKDLADSVAMRSQVWWSREDMSSFCRDVKELNPGFKCPSIRTYGYSTILDSGERAESVKKKLGRVHDEAVKAVEKDRKAHEPD